MNSQKMNPIDRAILAIDHTIRKHIDVEICDAYASTIRDIYDDCVRMKGRWYYRTARLSIRAGCRIKCRCHTSARCCRTVPAHGESVKQLPNLWVVGMCGGVSAHSFEERFLIRFVVRDHLRNPMRDTVCRLRFTNFLQASPYE